MSKVSYQERKSDFGFFLKGIISFWVLLDKEKKRLVPVLGLMILVTGMELIFPLFLKALFDRIPDLIKSGNLDNQIFLLVGLMFGVKIITVIIERFVLEIRFLKSLINLENDWVVRAQEKLLTLSLSYHEEENTGKKVAKINKGCERLVDILARLYWGLLPKLIYLIISMIIVLILDWRLGLLFLAPVIPAGMLYFQAFRKFKPVFEEWEEGKEESTGIFCESIINVQTVQGYVQEAKERARLSKVRDHMKSIDKKASVGMQRYLFTSILLLQIFFVITIVFGIYLAISGEATLGTIVYVIATGSVAFGGIWHIIHEYVEIQRRMISVLRMKDLLEKTTEIKNRQDAFIPRKFQGEFKFNQIDFRYSQFTDYVLKEIGLDVYPGQMVAFVGRSGEGKTTLIKLVSRMYDPIRGKITLDGEDIKNLDLYWYRRNFAIVQQEIDIFDDTIFANVSYACLDTEETEVVEAIKAANLYKSISNIKRFPRGIYTQVGERGVRLSGGERQRVGIARAYLAIMKGARVLILDEATSDLDSEAERAIQKMINRLKNKESISILAIAHRLSTIKKSDKIYVIDGGRIIEEGDHNSLVGKNGLYAQLVDLQKIGEIRK